MDTQLQPKKKTKKTINGLPKALFNRLQFIITFDDTITQLNDTESFWESYVPSVRSSCSIACRFPKNPVDVDAIRCVVILPGRTPYFKQPNLPSHLPPGPKKGKIEVPRYPSIVPLLITANHAGINTRNYHFVTQRNSVRKITMNDEDFVISVMRFGSTLFLRRFASYHIIDKSNPGFRFEEMCTTKCDRLYNYNQLLDVEVGGIKILMMGETDAIKRDNGDSVELKCQKANLSKFQEHDWWLQAYLSGTKSIIHGRYAKDDPTKISTLKEYQTSELSNKQCKTKMFNRLYCVLQWLISNVDIKRSYILRGYKDETTKRRTVRLYEVTDKEDKRKLVFINKRLLNMFSCYN